MSITREIKRIFILSAYIILFGLFFFWIYKTFINPLPTCSDRKQNQNEEGVDCGGVCAACIVEIKAKDLIVERSGFVYGSQTKTDVYALIKNPNDKFGSSWFNYEFTLKDSSGTVLSKRAGHGFILPFESKNIIETSLDGSTDSVSSVEFKIVDTQWQEFIGYEEPELNITNKRYDLISGGDGYSEVYALLTNESPFDFNLIRINIILRDAADNPIALNRTEVYTINSGEQRDFKLKWPDSFPGDVRSIDMEAEANVFDTQNFIQKYFPRRKFQE